MSILRQGLYVIPLLHIDAWFRAILQTRPEVLTGGYKLDSEALPAHLEAFWSMYEKEDPEHPVFTYHRERLRNAIPYFLFSDEGRGYRKSPVMIWAFESVMGLNTSKIYEKNNAAGGLDDGPNLFLDAQQHTAKLSSLKSRFLLGILPHEWYRKKQKRVFHNTFDAIAKKCAEVFWEGVSHEGQTYYGVMIGIKGDSPALVKLGRLNRAFNRLGHDKGVCHLCLGGKAQTPWEDMRPTARWRTTIGSVRPWDTSMYNEWLQIPHSDTFPEQYFRNDPFHVVKIGIGRHFCASALIVLSSWDLWPGASSGVEQRLDRAYSDFSFCCQRELRQVPHVKAFTRDGLHFPNHLAFPFGGWKGADTMLLCRWLVRVLRRGPVTRDAAGALSRPNASVAEMAVSPRKEVYQAILDAACALVHFFQVLNHGGLWLDRATAGTICVDVNMFCAAYTFLARQMLSDGLCRFHIEPSLHVFSHFGQRIQSLLDLGAQRIMSPAAFLCENSEDFIGRIARLSRRCSARLPCNRTLQRYLIKAYFDWLTMDH